jgi:hypothetical protein
MKNGRRLGKLPNPYEPPASPTGKLNVTDPDARNMKSARGFVFGYNARLVAGERQIIIAAEIAASGSDFDLLGPMVRAAQGELQDAGISDQPGVVLADAGYWSNTHIDATRAQGMTPIVAVDAHTRTGSLRNRRGGPMTSCAACSPARPAARSTRVGKRSSNRSSDRSRPTAASVASNAAATPQCARNGG